MNNHRLPSSQSNASLVVHTSTYDQDCDGNESSKTAQLLAKTIAFFRSTGGIATPSDHLSFYQGTSQLARASRRSTGIRVRNSRDYKHY
eukprot:scaffold24032_cov85-Skeletonema_marinoi.AAC.1